MSLRHIIRRIILLRDIRASTESHYWRVAEVFISWNGSDDPETFTSDRVSEMLRDKSRDGRSPYYLRSLRSVLKMLLSEMGKVGRVRPVRLPKLDRPGWSIDDLARLIESAYQVSEWWGTLVEAGYYTGLSLCDLLLLRGAQVSEDGWVRTKRRKTGAAVLVAVPPRLAGKLRQSGDSAIWKWELSLEWFRRKFQAITASVGLAGSFKMLRAASGSAVEAMNPGAGHKHLANTPDVFSAHYQTTIMLRPTMPPEPRKTQ